MVAVDSSAIIHLARIGKLQILQKNFRKIKITQSVEQEITKEGKHGSEEIKKCIGKWIEVKKLEMSKKHEIVSAADLEIVALAEQENDFILTNDEGIILLAKARGIETMWITTFIVLCLKKKLIDKGEAKQILYDLIKSGLYLRTDTYEAVQKIIDEM